MHLNPVQVYLVESGEGFDSWEWMSLQPTLHMGSAPYVSRLARIMGERIAQGDRGMRKLKNKIVKILSCPVFSKSSRISRPAR